MSIKTKKVLIKYDRDYSALFAKYRLSKYKALSVLIQVYKNNLNCGFFSLGIDINYRLKNIDHIGFGLILKLLLFEIEFEISDYRHQVS